MIGKCSRSTKGIVLISLLVAEGSLAAEHSFDFSSRLRAVDIEVGEESGRAASALLRLQLNSSWSDQWSSLVEVDHVASFFKDDHSDGKRLNGKPLVPDVPGTELNQLALRYRGDETEATLGRQRIEFDDQRFVGSASYWQQDQTFDALLGQRRLLTSSRFNYAYIRRVQRIFTGGRGEPADSQQYEQGWADPDYFPGYQAGTSLAGAHRHNTHLARLELNEWDYSQLVAYGYAIDNKDWAAASNYTMGARYRFSYRVHPMRYRLILELAGQENRGLEGRPRPNYHLAELSVGYKALEGVGRYEVLGSDQNTGFATPLGSSYLFQGFAGVFVGTPGAGLKDASVRVNWRAHPWELSTRFHHFSAQSGRADYGRELDIELQYKPASGHVIQLRFADFRAHASADHLMDVRQLYLDYLYNF